MDHGGLNIVLPKAVSDRVKSEFGQHCQQFNTSLLSLDTSKERCLLVKSLLTYLKGQLELIDIGAIATDD